MKKIFEFRNVIILFLLIVIILEYCNPKGIMPNRVIYSNSIDSIPYPVHDTIPYETEVEVEVPVEVPVTIEVHDTITLPVDTMLIMKNFYVKNPISEVLTLPNGIGTIVLNETITENKVMDRSFTNPKVKKQVVYDTIRFPEKPMGKLYYGVNVSSNDIDFVNSIGFGVMYKTKEDKIYRVDIGVNNRVFDGTLGRLTPYVGGGVYWKFKSKGNKY